MAFIKYLILLVLLSSFSWASDCRTIDLRNQFGAIRDQQDIGWCYAYTAADLINFKYRSELGSHGVSPFHIALLYNANDGSHFASESGDVSEGIKLALEVRNNNNSIFNKGICLQSLDEKLIKSGTKISVKEFYGHLKTLKKLFDKAQSTNDWNDFIKFYKEIALKESVITSVANEDLINLFKYSTSRDLGINFINLFCSESERYYSKQYVYPIKYRLGGVKVTPQKVGKTLEEKIEKPEQLIREIKSLLNQDQPSGVGFYYSFLQQSNPVLQTGPQHAAIVVGQELLNNECHLIIRNSWGNCPGKESKNKYSKNVTKCESGNLWIKERLFKDHITSVEFIK
jgi:hypothetical protein